MSMFVVLEACWGRFFLLLGACRGHVGDWEALSDVSGSRTAPRDQLGSILDRFCVHLGGIWEPLGSHFGASCIFLEIFLGCQIHRYFEGASEAI